MKSGITLLVAAILVSAVMAAGPAHGQIEFTLGGGLNSPLGDYGDQANKGYAIISGIAYRPAPFVALGVEVSLYGNGASDELLAGLGVGAEMSSTIQQYTGMAKLLVPVRNHFLYGKAVVGSYRGAAKVTTPLGEAKVSNTDAGFGLGGGLLISGEKTSSFFLEVIHHSIAFDEGGDNTNFVSFNAGAVFTFSLID